MAYKLLDFADIYTAVLEELKIPSSDTVEVARIKRDINSIYINEVVPFSRWKWLEGYTTVKVPQVYIDGTVDITFGYTTATLSTAPSAGLGSFKNKIFSLDSSAETYTITAHTAGSTTITIDRAFNGTTTSAGTFKIWSDWVALPTDLRETVEIWHDFDKSPLSARGLQEFRKIQNATRKTQARPSFTYTGDFIDPTPNDDETESDRYRALWVHPAIFSSATNLHVSYIKEVSALEDDGDEPAMGIEDRIVLLYGALARAWRRQRNPEASAENFQLFQNKLARMAGKVEDSFDKPSLNPDSLYISAKRGPRGSARSLGALYGTGTGGGSATQVTYLEDVTINGANITGNVTVANSITVDGRDISADGTALDTVVSGLAAHLADTTDAHDASAISVVPTGNLAADDVQEALQELQGDIDTLNTDVGALETLANGKIYIGNASNEATEVTPSGDVTISNTGVTTIAANAVTNSKLAQMATMTIKGNDTVGTADPQDLTATEVTAMLDAVVGDSGLGGTKGLVPAPASGDAAADKYLKADGTWSAVEGVVLAAETGINTSTYWGDDIYGVKGKSGDALITANGDAFGFGTTDSTDGAVGSAYVVIESGANVGNSGGASVQTGGIYVVTGSADGTAATGEVYFESGSKSGTSGASGAVTFRSGADTSTSGASGEIQFETGASTNGNSGTITLTTGSAGGTRGSINANAKDMTLTVVDQVSIAANKPLRLSDADNSAYTEIKAASVVSGSYTITLPAAAPTANTALAYDGSNYVWSSAGGWTTYANENLSASGTVTNSTTVGQQLRRVTGNGAAVTLSNTPFGTGANWSDGLVIRLVGQSNTNTVTITHNDAANGCILNGNATLGQYDMIELQWDDTAERFIEVCRNF